MGEHAWTRASHATIPDLTYRISGLTPNHEYEFRVCAVNAAGPGQWSGASDGIFARPPPCAPKITSDLSIRDMTVIAGEEFTITVPFVANPAPHVSWTIVSNPNEKGCQFFYRKHSYFLLTNKHLIFIEWK